MRSPSERLTRILAETGLCTHEELKHCEPIVRRLSHDLPDFDSVWLDALVQSRLLTPWQAERIQADEVDEISVGRCQKQQPLGKHTFLATLQGQQEPVVLRKLMAHDASEAAALDRRLADLISSVDRSRATAGSVLVLPEDVIQPTNVTETDVASKYLVSRCIPGWSMDELLIRGGRLPSGAVAEIGRELLTAQVWFETARLLHGDLVARNVRLNARGTVHLTDPFARRLVQPHFPLTDRLTLSDCDGIAPELAGTGRSADARSELYALGCLLWQLLTSRPVILSADPVTRIMKQKDHDIVDVRGAVPDCPEWMSRLIQAMTRRSPELRPASAAEVLKQWKSFSGNGLHHCRALVRQMPDQGSRARVRPLVRNTGKGASWRWPVAATAVLAVLVLLTARSGVLPGTLHWNALTNPDPLPSQTIRSEASQGITENRPRPMPSVDADGIIRLEPGKTYLAEDRNFPGSLRILCEQAPVASVIVEAGSEWKLNARSVELRGIRLSRQSDAPEPPAKQQVAPARHLLLARCASLAVQQCLIQSPSFADEFVGLAWHASPEDEGRVTIGNTVFSGGGYGVSFNQPPRACELDNVLLATRGSGMLCEFGVNAPDSWEITSRNVTQRFGFSLVDALIHPGGLTRISLVLTSSESVYAPQMAIVRLQAPAAWTPNQMQVGFRAAETGNPAVISPVTQPVVYIDQVLRQPVTLPESQISENSLLLAELVFSEPSDSANSEWIASSLQDFEGPKLTTVMPGIDVTRLPQTRHPQ
jgi:hypothetical protein